MTGWFVSGVFKMMLYPSCTVLYYHVSFTILSDITTLDVLVMAFAFMMYNTLKMISYYTLLKLGQLRAFLDRGQGLVQLVSSGGTGFSSDLDWPGTVGCPRIDLDRRSKPSW